MNPLIALLGFFNNVLHIEPVSILVDCIFWLIIFLIGFPLAAIVSLVRMVYLCFDYFFGSPDIDPSSKKKQELAVFITGCDSGFGKELVEPLTARGFTVFCGCLDKESLQNFKGNVRAIPLHVDVTSDKSVAEAYQVVQSWLAAGSGSSKRKRHFHALVNNAGILRVGLIDWATVADFKAAMDVNYLGIVRCVKEFMPIFKKQAAAGVYKDARIVNMISMAGLFHGGECFTPYAASKHAADAFTTNLRREMVQFGVHVTAVNPTFHQTPMANVDAVEPSLVALFKSLPSKQQKEYGEGYLKEFLNFLQIVRQISWRSKNVVDALEQSLIAKNPPARMLVGMDCKYAFAPCNLLPTGVGIPTARTLPAAMKK